MKTATRTVVAVARTRQLLAGYWGRGDRAGIEQQLNRLAPSTTLQVQAEGEAGLAASGLTEEQDIWVRWDSASLTLGRSVFGRMPLFWLEADEGIWFSSRIAPLIAHVASPQVSPSALLAYSTFSYVPTPETPVLGIYAVSAGGERTWRQGLESTGRPFTGWPASREGAIDEDRAVGELRALLEHAVHRQVADLGRAKVGVFLSGGLDSAAVAALLVRSGVSVEAFSLDFGNGEQGELAYATQVARFLKIPLVPVDARPCRVRAALAQTVRALDLPYGDGVSVPLFLLGRAAAGRVGVVFNGEGGDQLFGGWTNKPLIAAGVYGGLEGDAFIRAYLRTFHRFWGFEKQVFAGSVLAAASEYDPGQGLAGVFGGPGESLLHRLRRANLALKGAQNIQPRATALALVHGLAVRSPFCDQSLAEWTFRLPSALHLQGACEKYLLKRAVELWLPPSICWREKRGMGVPLTPWCLGPLWGKLGHWLNPGVLEREGRFAPQLPHRLLSGELGGYLWGRRVGELLWLLLVWQLWRVEVLGETVAGRSLASPFWLPGGLWRYLSRKEL